MGELQAALERSQAGHVNRDGELLAALEPISAQEGGLARGAPLAAALHEPLEPTPIFAGPGSLKPKYPPDTWRRWAVDAVHDLLSREYACVWSEVQAKLSEPAGIGKRHIDPHHLTTARHRLLAEGKIVETAIRTRGGAPIHIVTLAPQRGVATLIDTASARKRLLQARYFGWTRAHKSRKVPNLIGKAGEVVTHASLLEAAATGAGYALLNPSTGQVSTLFNRDVPIGPLDNAAALTVFDENGYPVPVVVVVEVKNIREWIYPRAAELYQLLSKAAQLQAAQPNQRFVPVLVCRKPHHTLFAYAKALGFVVFYTIVQPILMHSDAPPEAVGEVVNELGYNLEIMQGPHKGLSGAFAKTLPKEALAAATRWAETISTYPDCLRYFEELRDDALGYAERGRIYGRLTAYLKGDLQTGEEYEGD